jgi:hypothetical protein
MWTGTASMNFEHEIGLGLMLMQMTPMLAALLDGN